MRLFDFPRAPNPQRARIFIAEKGLDIPRVPVNLYNMEQLSPEFLAINPLGTVPTLETDDGSYLTETVAICHYLEKLQPEPVLMGSGATEEAQVLMWNNIVEQNGLLSIAEMLRNWSPGFKNHVFPGSLEYEQMPELIERGRRRSEQFFDHVEIRLGESRYLAGEKFSLADISLLAITDFARWVELDPPASRPALARWYGEVSDRPSARA
ncbi:MAG: glutathione S-transferase family protein [Gammaproteobacteria bacterium]|jgi:glutathione S-transferase|nr:glutathione S-transferase family protein [Gammaproteobacteria bacterium]MDP6616966.1 glutathione S-transferase family protein [Gammaproteobacteria bacterium]MDP6695874.1 glutathione S-transferase family protein [Gammaproteobacteria bacterium]